MIRKATRWTDVSTRCWGPNQAGALDKSELEAELDADGAADIVLPSIDATPFRDSSTVAYGSPVQSTASTGGVVDVVVFGDGGGGRDRGTRPSLRLEVDSPPVTVEQSEDAPADVRRRRHPRCRGNASPSVEHATCYQS